MARLLRTECCPGACHLCPCVPEDGGWHPWMLGCQQVTRPGWATRSPFLLPCWEGQFKGPSHVPQAQPSLCSQAPSMLPGCKIGTEGAEVLA